LWSTNQSDHVRQLDNVAHTLETLAEKGLHESGRGERLTQIAQRINTLPVERSGIRASMMKYGLNQALKTGHAYLNGDEHAASKLGLKNIDLKFSDLRGGSFLISASDRDALVKRIMAVANDIDMLDRTQLDAKRTELQAIAEDIRQKADRITTLHDDEREIIRELREDVDKHKPLLYGDIPVLTEMTAVKGMGGKKYKWLRLGLYADDLYGIGFDALRMLIDYYFFSEMSQGRIKHVMQRLVKDREEILRLLNSIDPAFYRKEQAKMTEKQSFQRLEELMAGRPTSEKSSEQSQKPKSPLEVVEAHIKEKNDADHAQEEQAKKSGFTMRGLRDKLAGYIGLRSAGPYEESFGMQAPKTRRAKRLYDFFKKSRRIPMAAWFSLRKYVQKEHAFSHLNIIRNPKFRAMGAFFLSQFLLAEVERSLHETKDFMGRAGDHAMSKLSQSLSLYVRGKPELGKRALYQVPEVFLTKAGDVKPLPISWLIRPFLRPELMIMGKKSMLQSIIAHLGWLGDLLGQTPTFLDVNYYTDKGRGGKHHPILSFVVSWLFGGGLVTRLLERFLLFSYTMKYLDGEHNEMWADFVVAHRSRLKQLLTDYGHAQAAGEFARPGKSLKEVEKRLRDFVVEGHRFTGRTLLDKLVGKDFVAWSRLRRMATFKAALVVAAIKMIPAAVGAGIFLGRYLTPQVKSWFGY